MAFDLAANSDLYPFEPRRFDRGDGIHMSHLDEGPLDPASARAGDGPVVMVHGNPTWSFYFRELVLALRGGRRVVVPDHVGCGLSDKPGDDRYRYTLRSRIDDLDALLESLGVRENVTLVLHDWGGAIGLGWAARRPERLARLVLLNTSGFRLPATKPLPATLRLGRDSRLGALLIRGGNAFAGMATRWAVTRPLDPRVARALVAPYDSWANRIATLRFVQDIPLGPGHPAWEEILRIEEFLPTLRRVPTLVAWGARDFVFDDHFYREWRSRLPEAEFHYFEDAGHYVLEDAADRVIPLVREFLSR